MILIFCQTYYKMHTVVFHNTGLKYICQYVGKYQHVFVVSVCRNRMQIRKSTFERKCSISVFLESFSGCLLQLGHDSTNKTLVETV